MVPYQEDEPPRMSGFEGQQGLFMGEPDGCRKLRSHSQRAHAKSYMLQSQTRGSNLKEAWVRPTCWFWRASWTGRRKLGIPLRTQNWQQPFWGICSTMRTLGLASTILGVLPLAYRHLGLTQPPASHHQPWPPQAHSRPLWDVAPTTSGLAQALGSPGRCSRPW